MRTALAIVLAVLVVLPALMDLGGAGLARQGSRLALAMPFQSTLAARQAMLDSSQEPSANRTRIAIEGLRTSPMLPDALVELAGGAALRGDEDRRTDLLRIAGDLGWRQDRTQMAIYANAVERGAGAEAVDRASAILRRDRNEGPMSEALLADARANPAMGAALRSALGQPSRWGDRFLVAWAPEITDDWLIPIMDQRRDSAAELSETQQKSLLSSLVEAGRVRTAYRLSSIDGGIPRWPAAGTRVVSGPFDWRLPNSYRTTGSGGDARLVPTQAKGGAPVMALLSLQPGRWRFVVEGAVDGRWLFDVRCGDRYGRPLNTLRPGAEFSVPADCDLQVLSVAVAGNRSAARLPNLSVERAR